jgi:hypothetical protein
MGDIREETLARFFEAMGSLLARRAARNTA